MDDMILSREDSKDSTKRCLELITAFGKAAGNKINIQTAADSYPETEQLRKSTWH